MSTRSCSIAIVGMACRYPDADTIEQLFENSLAQRRSFRKIPEIRMASEYFDESGKATDQSYSPQVAVIKGFNFDREWFRVSQKSYEVTDLSHWLALTVAKETIENIRFRSHKTTLDNENVRVIVGNTLTGEFSRANVMRLRWPYVRGVVAQYLRDKNPFLGDAERANLLRDIETRYKKPFPIPNEDFLAGGLANTIAGRICNHFDFKGGGYTVDGACSSSLLAVTDACSALASGDADMVLAGGVDLSLDPFELVGFSRTGALARNEMLVYDEDSTGFWPGEGCGFVALMRYEDAIEQCEHVHTVIQGWGVSSDGRGGLTRPESEGQILALQRCYKRAGYGIETVGYFEGHGTGTKVGDTAELKALISARSNSGTRIEPAVISSIKANIGHTKAAAGLAGLLRATKSISENILPPSTGCRRPHKLFADGAGNLRISNRTQAWKSSKVARRAGVSAMGFGGINVHISLEEAPVLVQKGVAPSRNITRLNAFQNTELFLFAAWTREELAWTINHIEKFAKSYSQSELTDLAVELARRATRGALYRWRAAIVATRPSELYDKLVLLKEMLLSCGEEDFNLEITKGVFVSGKKARGRIGLVFSGQGSPTRAQGGVSSRRFDQVRHIYQQANLDLFTNQKDTDFAQPAIVTASLGGLKMLQRIGVDGDIAIGHSLGEMTALHWAGHFDADSLLGISKTRGQLMSNDSNAMGAMVAINATREQISLAINRQKNLFIANINSPVQTVVSGGRREVETLLAKMQQQGVSATILPLRQAFHSPMMLGVSDEFREKLGNINFLSANRQIISTVTGTILPTDTNLVAHLGDQMILPVDFLAAVNLAAKEADFFIEVGPGDLLTNLIRSFCDTPVISVDVGGESLAPFLHAAAATYVLGCATEINNLFNDRFARPIQWDWAPIFFQNPCEQIQAQTLSELEVDPELEPKPNKELIKAQQNVPDTQDNTLERLRHIIAEHTGLLVWSLEDSSRMLSDLHLNSITVGEIVTQLIAASGMAPPVDPTQYADASLSEIATTLDHLKKDGFSGQPKHQTTVAGVDTWIRYFEVIREYSPRPKPCQGLEKGKWEGFFGAKSPSEELLKQLNKYPHRNGIIVFLNETSITVEFSLLLQAAQRCSKWAQQLDEPLYFVVVQHGWGASGFARSFYLENKEINTLVINLVTPEISDSFNLIIQEIDATTPGFREVFITETGKRMEPRWKLVKLPPTDTDLLINDSDVVLVTGGGKGICAECGYQLARRTGCSLLILGRSKPQDSDELANNLERMRQSGLRVSYKQADVTDAAEVTAGIASGVSELGAPITAIVHGAGLNQPRAVTNLSPDNIQATVSPKIDGLDNLLAVIDPDQLKLLVNFSSIIARIGLQGEADYALANEWLSHKTEKFRELHPHCRCFAFEWSVWSGTGMGQRLGRLDILESQGISAISVDEGVSEFLRLIDTPDLPVNLIVSGRFGNPPTIIFDRQPLKLFRFIDSILVYYPDTELIAECHLSPKSDPYLDDHVLNGERIFPAVMALEAMTEGVSTLMGLSAEDPPPLFRDISFRKAIVVPDEGLTLRLALLADTENGITVAIRCATTNFQVNHIEVRCTLQNGFIEDSRNTHFQRMTKTLPFEPIRSLYQNVLFQNGRFKRIEGYQIIQARRCYGQLSSDGTTQWFYQNLPQTSLLGDPGARDAALHAIQVCIPHKIVIPIAVEEINFGVLDPSQAYQMSAIELMDHGNELVYDLTIIDSEGRQVESWRRITLRVVGDPLNFQLNSPLLISPYFERQVIKNVPETELKVLIEPLTVGNNHRTDTIDSLHRPDGKPDPLLESRFQSVAYSENWKLSLDSALRVGCDLQSVSHNKVDGWELLLGKERLKLAMVVTEMINEPLDVSATRIWTILEAIKKAGLSANSPLVVDPDSSAQWLVFHSGDFVIFSSLFDETSENTTICITAAFENVGIQRK